MRRRNAFGAGLPRLAVFAGKPERDGFPAVPAATDRGVCRRRSRTLSYTTLCDSLTAMDRGS